MFAWTPALGSSIVRFVAFLKRSLTPSLVSFPLILFAFGCGSNSSTLPPNPAPSFPTPLFPQVQLDGKCVPRFGVPLPVFGPAGSIPRVDAGAHTNLTVTMKEIDQQVLPQGYAASCGVTLGPTRVWAYETKDTNTGTVLGAAHFPAVTIVAQRGTATQMEYVNQLPSFNPSNPEGAGLVQRLLPADQTIHWADPLQSGCGMQMQSSQSSPPTDDNKRIARSATRAQKQMAHVQLASYSTAHSKLPASGSLGKSAMASSMSANGAPSGPCAQQYLGPIPATVHLHGAEIAAAYDGDPESWFTPNGLKGSDYHTIGNPTSGRAIYEYPNSQEPGTLWFHDHALGITRLNVYAGLAGFYFLKDSDREPQGYPSGAQEIEMAVQDRMFDKNSQPYLKIQQQSINHPFWAPGFEGDVATVNGAAFPYLNVEPRRYRFHILNGSLNRGYEFVFKNLPVYLVGADDNYFDQPVPADPNGVPVSPGERVDIIVDFTNFAGQKVELTNARGGQYVDLSDIMEFRVSSAVKSPDTTCDPASPNPSSGICGRKNSLVRLTDGKGNVAPGVKVDRVRQLVLYDYVKPSGGMNPTDIIEYVNGTKWDGLESPGIAHDFPVDGVSELPRVGSIEEWDIVYLSNMAMASHPVHLHLSQFQVLNRQNMAVADMNTNDDPKKWYLAAWKQAYGTNPKVPLPTTCTSGNYCPNYGPPLDYLTPNADGALGGNPAFSPYIPKDCASNPQDCPMPPRPSESGWKDTADAFANQVLRILVRWTPSDVPVTPNSSYAGENFYKFDPTQGYYVWHCHVLTHEDNEMMRPYRVVP
jgi:FtsP/CotA-like multicopper oxidase with cupredoxin domain